MSGHREEILRTPVEGGVAGVVTVPDGAAAPPAFVLLNAGWLRKVGPNRLHVRIARSAADLGHPALRFDLPGIGDSPVHSGDLPLRASNMKATREVMDVLEKGTGARSFVLVGLCSGADLAYRVALEDERVRGVVFLDGFPFRTPGWYWHHYGRRIGRPDVWRRFLARLVGRRKLTPGRAAAGGGRDLPTREEAARGLRVLAERETRLLFVYTGGMSEYYNHPGQFASLFPHLADREGVEVAHLPEVDHIFSVREGQHALVERIRSWAARLPAEPRLAECR